MLGILGETMKIHILISLSVLYSSTWAQTQQCNPTNKDCSCKDVSYEICHTPPASQEVHVGSLEECIQNCDLFGSFGQCNYLLYFENSMDENCKLISNSQLEQYLDACSVVGQPLRDAYGDCMQGFASNGCSSVGCTSGCHTCDVNDACGLYAQTECTKKGNPGETYPGNIPDYRTCLSVCTSQQQSNPWTYVVFDKEKKECICYPDGLRSCMITAVPFGMTLSQVEDCDGCVDDNDCESPTPVCSGRCVECETNTDCTDATKPFCNTNTNICEAVECLDDSDCLDPIKPICDVADQICKPECTTDADCNTEDYCSAGKCTLGCRNVGDLCSISNGVDGKCNGVHECVQTGGSILTKLSIVTRAGDCVGCPRYRASGDAGATIMMATDSVSGTKNCTTSILDHPADDDYSGQHDFADFVTLSECFLFGLSDLVNEFSVSWTGAGTWTPEKFILERESQSAWPYCCYNGGGLAVSEGQSQTFECIAVDSSVGLNC